jgi:hypothetical protein
MSKGYKRTSLQQGGRNFAAQAEEFISKGGRRIKNDQPVNLILHFLVEKNYKNFFGSNLRL